jgi:hypothetical protein
MNGIDSADVATLIASGMDEITVRVSQYDRAMVATQWQALVKFANRQKPWGVGVAATPEEALTTAVGHALALVSGQTSTAPVRVRVRNRQT